MAAFFCANLKPMKKLGPYLTGPNNTADNGIYTGDARKLCPQIPDNSVDLVLTDPPWGINYPGYKDDPSQYLPLIHWVITETNRILKPGAFAFVYQASKRLRETWPLFPPHSRIFAACKNFIQIKNLPVEYGYDPIVFWQKSGDFYAGKGLVRDWHVANTTRGRKADGVTIKTPAPPRPLQTVREIIKNMTLPNAIIADLFLGTGTTAAAAKLEQRHWLGFEINPETAKFSRQRVKSTDANT